ncbi:MAG: DUF4129 domain-containing protein [Ktedonobacterales bacterium]
MSQSSIQTPTRQTGATHRQTNLIAPRARWLSADTLVPALVAVALVLLEALPVQAWLLAMGAYTGGGVSQAAFPFWWTLALLGAFWLIGRIGRNWPFIAPLMLAVLLGIGGFLLSLPLSPSAYAADGSAWQLALRDDLATGAPHLGNLLALAVLIAYLGWRGFSRGLRKSAYEASLRLFIVGMVALVMALLLAAALPIHVQTALAADLTLLLLMEVFAGLVGLALAKMQALRERMSFSGATMVAAGYDRRWLLIALGLAGSLLAVTLLISLLFNFDASSAAGTQLGLVGAAITSAWNWLIQVVAAVILWIFNAIAALFGWHGSGAKPPSSPNKPSGVQPHPQVGRSTTNRTVSLTATAIILLEGTLITLTALFGVGLLIYGVRMLFFRTRKPDPQQEADEERESLDMPGLLGAQMRALFASKRKAHASAEDPLPRASMRWLYRETLRAATATTLGRAAHETPDEFAGRLNLAISSGTGTAHGGQAELARDLADITAAYDQARYDDREPEQQAHTALRQQTERIVQALRNQSRQERKEQQRALGKLGRRKR